MIQIIKDMEIPEECHDCPFQIRFKDGVADKWYMRRCVIEDRVIEYPSPQWCPIKPIKSEDALTPLRNQETVEPFHKCSGFNNEYELIADERFNFCPYCGRKVKWYVNN